MPLFQTSVLKKYLSHQDTLGVEKAYEDYAGYFLNPEIQDNIRSSKEEQFQEGFLRELFVKILGYTLNPEPNFNLTPELKNEKGSKKTDGAILKDGKALGVVELKGTDTKDLDKVNEQAFNYKNNHTNCVYVITSNFEKLRFFIHNAVEHIEFNLFTLTLEEFKVLWLCIQVENLLNGIPQKVKDESLLAEENITKKLYKDYSAFKTALWRNMVKNHPDDDPLMLFKKTQKLLDRFLFIFFAEDSGLLPPNSIRKIIDKWKDDNDWGDDKKLYDIYKQYFGFINKGRPAKGDREAIFGYNGGLFIDDLILDNITIDDDILLNHTEKLSTYDFQSEVDVNILGHIFENSLSEIENITAELEGQPIDRGKTKRKKDGVFYTPKYITKYIVENTIGKLCEEKKAALNISDERFGKAGKRSRKGIDDLQAYRDWLLNLKICDPACGSGAFLNQALEFLLDEHRYLDELTAQYHKSSLVLSDIDTQILENNIYGVDINEESVEIAKLSLWLRTAQKGRKLTSLNNNIKCGNSLIDDPAIVGEKAFNWKKEFPKVFATGGFDVVIGNPPYVNIVNIENAIIRKYYQTEFSTFKNKCDLYSLFIERSFTLSRQNGILGFIFPNSWMGTSSFSKFRKKISDEITPLQLVELPPGVFSDAIVTTVIMTYRNSRPSSEHFIDLYQLKDKMFHLMEHKIDLQSVCSTGNYSYSFEPQIKLKAGKYKLGDVVEFCLGIKTSDDKRFVFDYKKDDNSYPMLRGKDIGRYSKDFNGDYIWYMPDLIKEKPGGRPRVLEHYLKPKILIQDIAKTINCTYDDENYLVNDTINVIHEVESPFNLHTLIALLNSKACRLWFSRQFPEGLHIKINQLQEIPLPKINDNVLKELSLKSLTILKLQAEFDTYRSAFSSLLQSKYDIQKLSKKLQNWHELEFKALLKELKKAKIHLGLSEEAEWMQYFNAQKQKAQELKLEIKRVDNEIDQMVYQLYGMTEEEIKVLEQS